MIIVLLFFGIRSAEAGLLEEKILKVQQVLKVSIVITEEAGSFWEGLTYDVLNDTSQAIHYIDLLEQEYSKYPIGYLNKINLKRIVLTQKLTLNKQKRAAIPDPYIGSLFLSIEPPENQAKYPHYLTHVLHHELHHYAEFSYWKSMSYHWEAWENTNETSFEYRGGGEKAYESLNIDWYHLSDKKVGFMNLYSTTAEEEDRAELVALIMEDHERVLLKQRLVNDFALQQKVLLIQFLLSEISGTEKGYWNMVLD